LHEALKVIKSRGRSFPIDGVYSILGLLPYGKYVKVDYAIELSDALREVMTTALKVGYGEPLAWHGIGSEIPGLC